MKNVIIDKQVLLLAIPLPEPFHLGFGVLHNLPRTLLVLTIETKSGQFKAVGEAAIDFPFSHYDAWDIYATLRDLPLVGMSLDDTNIILDNSWKQRLQDGCYAAQAALNMALDDARGQLLQKNVADLYGKIRSGGVILQSIGLESPRRLKQTLEQIFKNGRVPKIKCDQRLANSWNRIQIANAIACEYDNSFSVDFNASLNMEQWETICKKIRNSHIDRLLFVEQPINGTAMKTVYAHKLSLETTGIPVVADESFITIEDANVLGSANVFLNMKIQKLGGIRQALILESHAIAARGGMITSLVGGTFPTALGRSYDQLAVCVLRSVSLPSDGLQPASDWFKEEKHLIEEPFNVLGNGEAKAFCKNGIGFTPSWKKICSFIVPEPEREYISIRKTGRGNYLHLITKDSKTTYAESYRSVTGREPSWNISFGEIK